MPNCRDIDSLLTPYVDGEARPSDQAMVDAHMAVCPSCRERAQAESTARGVLRARRTSVLGPSAPPSLHARCAASRSARTVGGWIGTAWRGRMIPAAAAAAAILIVVAGVVWLSGRSATVLAAQLTIDHVKCFEGVNEASSVQPAQLEARLAERYGWQVKVPPASAKERLRLITARRCSYENGGVAHLMYRHNDRPVSLFVLPATRRWAHETQIMGHEAMMWSEGNQTFLLIAREPRADVQQLAAYVRTCNK